MMMGRRAARHPHAVATVLGLLVLLAVAYFVLFALRSVAGPLGVVAGLVAVAMAMVVVSARRAAARTARRAAYFAAYAPAVRPAAELLCARLDLAVGPFLAAGLPPLRRLPSQVDPGVWATEFGAVVRVGLPRGLTPAHVTAAGPWLAYALGVAAVRVTPDRSGCGRAVLIELHTRVPAPGPRPARRGAPARRRTRIQ